MTIFTGTLDKNSGYGRLAAAAARALGGTLSTERSVFGVCDPGNPTPTAIRFTMWESTELPPDRMKWRDSRVIIVPCEHNRKLFRKYTRRPIHVCPLFAGGEFAHLPPARPFRFLCIARDNSVFNRKGVDELIKWFTLAFPREPDVTLTIKQSPHCKQRWTYDKRITIVREDHDRAWLEGLLRDHHCGIFLSGAEAWNLPALELMAIGRPSILIPFGGPADFTDTTTSWHLPYKMVKAPQSIYQGIGQVAYPDKAGTIQAMREAYEDQILLAQKAIASAQRAADYTESRFAARLRSIVAQYGLQTDFS